MKFQTFGLVPVCCLLASVTLCKPIAVIASERAVMQFDIAAQPLDLALTRFSAVTGLQVLFESRIANGIYSPALKGTYTAGQALQRLLQGSDLTYRFSNSNTITLEKSSSIRPTQSMIEALPPVTVASFAIQSPEDPYNPDYQQSNAVSAAKTDTPIMETPISIQVVPKAVIKDQQAVQIGDAVKNVSGVFQGFSFGGFAEEFIIRGFNTNFNNYLDGFRFPAARLSLANAERVEVVKGAAANLYGQIQPGGLINIITKRPLAEAYYALEQQFGSYDLYRTTADATGPIDNNGLLLYRFNLEYLRKNSFRDFVFTDRIFVAPSLTWKISDHTKLDLDFMYSDEDTREDYGNVALGNRPAPIPRSRYLHEPATDKSNTKLYNTALTLTHAFNDNVGMRARFGKLNRDGDDPQTTGFLLDEQTGNLTRGFFRSVANDDVYQGSVDLTAKFSTYGVDHNALIGWDFYNITTKFGSLAADANDINIFDPIYSPINPNQPDNFFLHQTTEWNGVYFQDQITLFDNLHILGGGRYDWLTQSAGFSGLSVADATANLSTSKNERFSPRVGVLYRPWHWLSLYGNYVESLGSANSGIGPDGQIVDPEIGEQYEAGFKTSLWDDRLTTNVAFYHLTKKNVAVGIVGTPFVNTIGEARSRGVEIDVTGQITDDLSVIGTYAYTDAEILKGDNQGNRLWNVPRNAGSLWLKYDLQDQLFRGLSLGAGAYFQSDKEGDNTNSYQLPGWGRIDALVKYSIPIAKAKTTFQFNIENLLDHEYYTATLNDRFSINVGQPRTFMGSVKVEY